MGSGSSRNLEGSGGRLRSRRDRHASDACFFNRRSNYETRASDGRQQESSSSVEASGRENVRREGLQVELHTVNSEQSDQQIELLQESNAENSVVSSDEEKADSDDEDRDAERKVEDPKRVEDAASSSSDADSSGSRDVDQNIFEELPNLAPADSMSDRESRRNSGRRFWDALTRAASHRRSSAPITIVAIEEIDDNGSSTSRWNFQHWRASGDSEQADRDWEERRRHVRSHVWALQRLSGGLQISHGHARSCPAAGDFNGLCSCEAHTVTEDSGTRASISRIIMLAEALFEVLDEIHRQSVALSQSANMPATSLPAPENVVDSFPVRLYRKPEVLWEDTAQCHICLIEYDEGDQLRVLPCQHEYHQACVDKWLKEVHRVCPLCRGNVCEPEADTVAGI